MTSLFPKKVLVFLLSFFMIFGFISCSSDSSDTEDNRALSVGSSKFATLQEAVNSISNTKAAAPSYTIKLLRDVSDAGATIPNIGGNLTIDFGAYTYTLENSKTGITIADGATGITIANGNIVPGNNNKFDSIISSSGELEIDGLKIDAQNTEFDAIKADNGSIKIKGASEVKVAENKNVLNLSGKANASVVSENVSLAGGLTMAGTSSMDLTKGEFKIGNTSLEEGISITESEESKIEPLDETDETAINNINQYKKCLITFYVNNISTDLESQRITSGSTIKQPDDPSITGYTFDGWFADADCTIGWNFETAITENTTIYAKLDPIELTITFDVQGIGTAPEALQIFYGETIEEPEDIKVDGYTFGGWFADPDCTTEWNFNDAITANTTIYAKLELRKLTITFDVQGISNAPEAQQISYGETIEEPEDIKVDGYTFGGWFADPDCTIEWNFETAITENTTLYAKWEKVSGTNAKLSEEEVQFIMENLDLYGEMIEYSDDLKAPTLPPGVTYSEESSSYTFTLNSYFTDNLYKASGYISYEEVPNSHSTLIQDLDSIVIDGEEHSLYIKLETTLDPDTQEAISSLYVKMDEKEYVSSEFIVEPDEYEYSIEPPVSNRKEMHNAVLDIRNLMEEAVENNGILNIANVTVSDYTSENSYAFGKLVFDNYVGNNNLKLSGESTFVAYLFNNGNISDFKLFNDLTVTNLTSNNQNEYGFAVRFYYDNQRINLNVRRIGNQEFHHSYIYDFNDSVFDEPTDSPVDSTWEHIFEDEGYSMTFVFYEDGTLAVKMEFGDEPYIFEGTYSAETDTNGTFTVVTADGNVPGSYTIDGNKMTATVQGEPLELTKVE